MDSAVGKVVACGLPLEKNNSGTSASPTLSPQQCAPLTHPPGGAAARHQQSPSSGILAACDDRKRRLCWSLPPTHHGKRVAGGSPPLAYVSPWRRRAARDGRAGEPANQGQLWSSGNLVLKRGATLTFFERHVSRFLYSMTSSWSHRPPIGDRRLAGVLWRPRPWRRPPRRRPAPAMAPLGPPGAPPALSLVTGGNRGLGLAIAHALADRGDAVLLCARHPPAAGAPPPDRRGGSGGSGGSCGSGAWTWPAFGCPGRAAAGASSVCHERQQPSCAGSAGRRAGAADGRATSGGSANHPCHARSRRVSAGRRCK